MRVWEKKSWRLYWIGDCPWLSEPTMKVAGVEWISESTRYPAPHWHTVIGHHTAWWLPGRKLCSVIQTLVGYLRSQVLLPYDQRNHIRGQLGAYCCQCTKSWCDSTNNGMGSFSCEARKSPVNRAEFTLNPWACSNEALGPPGSFRGRWNKDPHSVSASLFSWQTFYSHPRSLPIWIAWYTVPIWSYLVPPRGRYILVLTQIAFLTPDV